MTALGLGTAQLGLPYGVSNRGGRPSAAAAEAIVTCAIERGVRLFDTAPAYGEAEELLGRLLPAGAGVRGVTKTPPMPGEEVREADCDAVARAAERSRELLGERLDALLVHHCSELAKPGGERLARRLAALRDDGLVGRLGVSVYSREELDAARGLLPVELAQVPLSAFDQRLLRDGTLAELRAAGVEVHTRSAFLQGLLLMTPEELPAGLARAAEPLRRWRRACAESGLAPIEAALRFARSAPGVEAVLVGANSAAELEQCLTAIGRPGDAVECASLAVEDPEIFDPRRWAA
jgi:aryl-alcohol dehydrogenase-like predicted oxidoreductase